MLDLIYYTKHAKRLDYDALVYGLADIKATIAIWRNDKPMTDPYMQKLYAEYDAFLIEIHKRDKAKEGILEHA